ncbi:hypothetical protein [Azotobacter armeniacus]
MDAKIHKNQQILSKKQRTGINCQTGKYSAILQSRLGNVKAQLLQNLSSKWLHVIELNAMQPTIKAA